MSGATWKPVPTPPPSQAVVSIRATPPATDLYKVAKSAGALELDEAEGERDAAGVLLVALADASGDFGWALGSLFNRRITAQPPPAASTSRTLTAATIM